MAPLVPPGYAYGQLEYFTVLLGYNCSVFI